MAKVGKVNLPRPASPHPPFANNGHDGKTVKCTLRGPSVAPPNQVIGKCRNCPSSHLGHICNESGVGAVIDEGYIPTTPGFRAYCKQFDEDSRHLALHVGEDYVLLGTAPPEAAGKLKAALKSKGCEFYPLGNTVFEPGLRLKCLDGSTEAIGAQGWNHFG